MKVLNKNNRALKKGFTLIEMVLALAIMAIMCTYVVSTFKVVNYSHLKVVTVNNMHDYASLNLQAAQNVIQNAKSISKSSGKIIGIAGGNDNYVCYGSTSTKLLPGLTQYHTGSGKAKWRLEMEVKTDKASKTVTITLKMYDNAIPSSDITYSDVMVVYCPGVTDDNFEEFTSNAIYVS
ncbi:MAG: type II secretion system protein [Clostridiales bacterium]|nr:type II secretion system protein [Clostridiales bacterium]